MNFEKPVSFREAVRQWAGRTVRPTQLTSAELAQVNRQIMRTSVTSAQTTIEGLLDRYKRGIESIINPQQVLREGAERTVTEGFNPATLRTFIKDYLKEIDYRPEEGTEGTLLDLSSDKRINLVVDTNVKTAQGAGRFVQQNADPDVVDLWPALELVRFEQRREPRHWEGANGLFIQACQRARDLRAMAAYGNTGRMVALKSSRTWEELGDPEYVDGGLGNPYPPFAFGSGMWTEEVSRDEAVELGLIGDQEKAAAAALDLESLFGKKG